MNRILKFRAWDSIQEMMVYNVGLWDGGEPMFPMSHIMTISSKTAPKLIKNAMGIKDESNTNILMQFTGLTDRNGKDVFEGDVLRYSTAGTNPHDSFDIDECWGEKHIGVVKFEEGSYKFISHTKSVLLNTIHNWEVIGNIYESDLITL